jgi:FkbM family methyltransferase
MKKVGGMFILDNDQFFENVFTRTYDKFEPEYLELAMNFCKKFDVALDGGAHYGSWTRGMAEKFKEVHAFEGCQPIFECLSANTGSYNNIYANHNALGHESKMVEIGPGPNYDNTGCGTMIGEGNTEMVRIDDLDLSSLDFLKLDVEGYEYYTLVGATETLQKYKPVVILEDKGHSEHFGVAKGEAGRYLESLGAVLLHNIRDRDFIYGWK